MMDCLLDWLLAQQVFRRSKCWWQGGIPIPADQLRHSATFYTFIFYVHHEALQFYNFEVVNYLTV